MNQDRNEAAQEFMEEIVDDLGYKPKNGRNQDSGSTVRRSASTSLIPWGIGIILFVALIAVLVMNGNGDSTEELASIQAGLNRLEERMTRLEGLKGLKELGGLEDRIIRLEKEEKRLRQEVKQIARQDVTSTPKKADPEVKQRYHTVRSGESLYTIAKKYGISTDILCKLNKITPKEPIRPGQRLLVGG
ncbi:MAG: LysM peptidoglycan-binding domain-containing protein [Candidatus Desulfacyla sp.]